MHLSVQQNFRQFNEKFEGVVPWMYLDVEGLVTVAVGVRIDPVNQATKLPFQFRAKPGIANPGMMATKTQIEQEWHKIKNDHKLAHLGHKAAEKVATLELNDAALNNLFITKLFYTESLLKHEKQFERFDEWPADAQLGLLSVAWAVGVVGTRHFHRFRIACEERDFAVAAATCGIRQLHNPGVVPRNHANKTLFHNAAVILAAEKKDNSGYRREVLYYPATLKMPVHPHAKAPVAMAHK